MRSIKLSDRRLWAYLEGEVTASEAAAVEAELDDSARVRERLSRLRAIRESLAATDPSLEQLDLVPVLRRSLGETSGAPGGAERRAVLLKLLPLAACLLLAVALPLWLRGGRGAPPADRPLVGTDELRPKGSESGSSDPDRWVGIQAYRVAGQRPPARVEDRLSARDGLLFAYSNLGPSPYPYLMLFAVDGKGEVFWFYPAHPKQGLDARAIPIAKSQAAVELPDLVRHRFAPGPLAIVGLFCRRPLGVLQVEEIVRDQVLRRGWRAERPGRLGVPETGQHILRVRVEP